MTYRKDLEICDSVDKALRDLKSGVTIMAGGFGLAGIPETMIEWTRKQEHIKDLHFISADAGDNVWGLARLYEKGKVSKHSASFIGRCKAMEHAYLAGKTEVELIPQGTLAEKIRCCGAGIPAFYTSAGLHTLYAEGKLPTKHDSEGRPIKFNGPPREKRTFDDGRECLLEEAFPCADFAWIKAWKADKMGNCIFRGTAFNFNRIMADAANCTVVEADEIVEPGELAPESIHLSGLSVNRVFKGRRWGRFEVIKNASEDEDDDDEEEQQQQQQQKDESESIRHTIAKRAAKEFVRGSSCNLGAGMPTLAASYAAKEGRQVYVQSENGIIGVGEYPRRGEEDSDWINAGKETVTPVAGASVFGSDVSFGQIRGGHLDLTVLGALECSARGDVANYLVPGKTAKGMGGAMDLVASPPQTRILVVQSHRDRHGRPKIKQRCDLPLTGARCVNTIVTELACFDVDHGNDNDDGDGDEGGGLTLRDYNPNTTIDEIREKTAAPFRIGKDCKPWSI